MTKKDKLNRRIALLQNGIKIANAEISEKMQNSTSSLSYYTIDGIVRDVASIMEELKILTLIQPYL